MMRLRICVHRHELPLVKLLIKAPDEQPTPISKLLEQVNALVPLESEGWGLEDYAVAVEGYECLHYLDLHSILKDNDEVSIRALQTNDIKARIVSGRMQISNNGVHLLDGIPFGRQALRRPHRPEVHIPPLKRRRLTEEYGQEAQPPVYHADQHNQLRITAEADIAEQDDQSQSHETQDNPYTSLGGEAVSAGDNTQEECDVQVLRRREGSSTRRRRSVQFADLGATSSLKYGDSSNEEYEEDEDDDEEDDADFTPEEEDGSEDSESESSSENENVQPPQTTLPIFQQTAQPATNRASVKSTKPNSSTSSSDLDSELESSESSSDSTSDDSSDDTEETTTTGNNNARHPETFVAIAMKTPAKERAQKGNPPGQGKKDTQERNKRRKARKRLDYLKLHGKLHGNATMADLRLYEAEERGDIPSKFEVYGRYEASKVPSAAMLDSNDNGFNPQQTQTTVAALHSNSSAANLQILKDLLHLPPKESNVQVPTSPSGSDPPDEMPATETPTLQTADTQSPNPAARQSRLDVASSRRLLFGSLGVRAPRSKEDEDKLRTKFGEKATAKGKNGRSRVAAEAYSPAEAPEPENNNEISDEWKSRINLTAVECVEEGIILSAPPFPFQQRWDPQQQKRGKKRKRPSQVEAWTYEEDEEEWAGLDYDDPVPVAGESQAEDASSELLELPEDLTSYPRLTRDGCTPGTIIAFTRMEVSKATNWEPGISPVRTARIEDFDNEVLVLSLAKRDRPQAEYDEHGGRMYDNLEMPDADGDDDGTMEVAFYELADVYLLQHGSDAQGGIDSMIPDSVPPDVQAGDSEVEGVVDDGQGRRSQSQYRRPGEESQELQAAQHQISAASASDDSNTLIEASA